MKQTAVEWLVEQLNEHIRKSAHNKLDTKRSGDYRIGLRKAIDFCEQAKEMEKQQIIDAWNNGQSDGVSVVSQQLYEPAKKYYNETFNL